MKKFSGMLIATILLIIGLAGCTNDSSNDSGDKQEMDVWYSLSGDNGKNFEKLVDEYNEQSDDYHMNAIYQGDYEDTMTKIRAAGEDDAPALLMASGTPRKYLSEQDFVVPVQEFIDDEDYDTSDFNEGVISRYTIDDKLYSMPFSASNAIMYYNKDMFEEAGLDPEDPPTTFEEYEEVGKQIKDETGNIAFSFGGLPGWYFEELLTNQGAQFFDNENGYEDTPTETLVGEEEGQEIFDWVSRMVDDGSYKYYGGDGVEGPFLSEDLAMHFSSSAGIRENVDDAPFEVGTAPFPVPEGTDPVGAQVGGNSMYITDKVPEEDREGAFEFLKHLSSPEVQAEWSSMTGYVPINDEAKDEEELQETMEEYPQFEVPVQVNLDTPAEPATSGPLSDDAEESREFVKSGLEKVFEGEDPDEALEKAVEDINELLEE